MAGFYPLEQVHRGQHATAWTVFAGNKPEPMDVEILGVLRGARGPGHDMILVQLHGAKAEYTGVVAGMSGSPVYLEGKLLGALSYRIGQFSKDPIGGVTPIAQMLEVRDLPDPSGSRAELDSESGIKSVAANLPNVENLRAMETPLVMAGFHPEAVAFWQKQMAGTGLDVVTASGMGSGSSDLKSVTSGEVVPGSAVSMQMVRGDLEVAATCTVTYVDKEHLLACGHPVLQAGSISLPMTEAEVVTTLASPLNAFKIINTGATIGSFDQDRDAAIRGHFGRAAHMIPLEIAFIGERARKPLHVEVLDLASMTPQAAAVAVFNSLLQTNESGVDNSYHVRGSIALEGAPDIPIDLWAPSGDSIPAAMGAALLVGDRVQKVYGNSGRLRAMRSIKLQIEVLPRRVDLDVLPNIKKKRDIVRAGATVMVEVTLRPYQQPERNLRIPVKLPGRLGSGTVRLLISDSITLDRTLDQPRQSQHAPSLGSAIATVERQHEADRVYVSLLAPETQASLEGRSMPGVPLSMANALEGLRSAQEASLNGESAELLSQTSTEGVVSGFQVLNLRIEGGGGLD